MQINTEDITVPWGQSPDPLDHQFGKWRLAVFQDVQESLDQSKLYFLYDPISDDKCITTGSRKGMTSLAVFDTFRKCFVGEILLRVQGQVKFIFALKNPSPGGGTAFVLITQSEDYGQFVLHLWRVNLSSDGLSLQQDPYSLLRSPISTDDNFICTMREDVPEIIVIHGPGMNVVRVNADATTLQDPIDKFNVAGSELSHFYDGFVSQGNIYFLSSSPDGHLDYSRVHILPIASRGPIATQFCQPDPQRGMPVARKQAGLDSISGFILLAGGEIDHGSGNVTNLVDYWVLDLKTFKWNQVPAQMPIPLIEPRLTATNSGSVYVWGDYDQPLPGMPPGGTHVRILRIKGFNTLSPPAYNQAMNMGQSYNYNFQSFPQAPTYPGQNTYGNQPNNFYNSSDNYNNQPGNYNNSSSYGNAPPYGASTAPYGNPSGPYGQQPLQYPPQQPGNAYPQPQYNTQGGQYPHYPSEGR